MNAPAIKNQTYKEFKEIKEAREREYNYYVYALIDPRNKEIFYIGKGTNARVFNHEHGTRTGIFINSKKTLRIQQIINSGFNCGIQILAFCKIEDDAYDIEAYFIELYKNQITNSFSRNRKEALSDYALYYLSRLKSFEDWKKEENIPEEDYEYYWVVRRNLIEMALKKYNNCAFILNNGQYKLSYKQTKIKRNAS